MQVVAGNCVGGSSVVYFAASLRAPSFVFDRQGSAGRRLWPSSITRAVARPLVRPGRAHHPGGAAELGRRALPRRAVRRGLRQRRAHLQPRARRRRPGHLHELQLDAVRLPVRREALDAAELPARGTGARRADPPAARGPADQQGRHAGLPVPGRVHRGRPARLPRPARRRCRSRRRSSSSGGRHDGDAGHPAALGARARRRAARGRAVLLLQRRPGVDGADGRVADRLGARPAPHRDRALSGDADRQAHRLDELRLPGRAAGRSSSASGCSRSTSRRSRTSCPRTARPPSRSGSASTRRR